MSASPEITGLFFDRHPDATAVVDADGTVARVNRAWSEWGGAARVLGTQGPEVGDDLGAWLRTAPVDDVDAVTDKVEAVLRGEEARSVVPIAAGGASDPGCELETVAIALDGRRLSAVTVRPLSPARVRAATSERRFRDLTESLDSVIFITSPTTEPGRRRMHYISPSYERIWGRSRESLLQDPLSFLEVIHPDDRDEVRDNLHQQAEGTWDREFRLVLDDGTERWIHSRAFPVRDAEGEIVEVVGIATDVTARRTAQELLRSSRAELQLILERLPVGIVMVRGEKLLYANHAAAGYVGIDNPEPYLGGTVTDFLHPEEHSPAMERLSRMVDTGSTLAPRELRARHRKGGWVTLDIVPVQVVDLDEGPAVLFVVWDVGTQRALTETLHRTQARFQAIFESSPMGIGVVGFDHALRDINSALRRILGLAHGDPIPENALSLVHPDGLAEAAASLEGLARGRIRRHTMETALRHTSGSWHPVRLHASAATGPSGSPSLAVVIVEDVSDRRDLEEQLRQSQRIESLGRLAGGIAHDFNNLVTVITGHAEFLMEDPGVDPSLKDDLQEIHRAGQRAAALTGQLLAFSRRTVMQPRILDLNRVVGGLVGMLTRTLGEDIRLDVDLDPTLSRVKVDPTQVEQVILNLAVNARDAMPRGGTIRIATFDRAGDDDPSPSPGGQAHGLRVALRVEDTGVGMDAAVRPHIFEPFFTTKAPGKGTGLGLAMVYGIVKQSGGEIEVESEPGRGSAFTVYLPAVDDEDGSGPTETVAERRPEGHETILLVEDEEGVRTLIERVLRSRGYRVLGAAEPLAALEILEHETGIDLLVTDVIMPGMGGGELARKVRERLPEMPVLFISGYADDEIVRHGVVAGEVPFLQKPFTGADILREIRSILDAR